ncbi:MAG: hypothetical protein E4G95_01520 [Bacteroidia bacterium]|nr:MAG: hypothetical protein E4G95_01520 [Bacteroidia bacterium]
MNRITAFFIVFSAISISLYSQEDLLALLDATVEEPVNYASATFKSTRIMNGHSIERMPPGQLDFRISHRFGRVNSGPYEFFGLDQANIHFGLETGIFDWLMIGVGRGTYEKTFDGFAKFSILRQSTGVRIMPVSLSLFSSMAVTSVKWPDPERVNYFSSRMSYVHQLLIARKFSQRFSAQITPSYVHRNMVATELDPNDLWSMGIGARLKLTSRISLNAEYYYLVRPVNDYMSQEVYNPLSVGFDIETGGHVFQIILTNSVAMIEKGFIGETTGDWLKGDIHLGFNISRVFTFKKK